MKALLLAASVCIGLAGPAIFDPVTEALFAEGIFDDMPDGQSIRYRHSRSGGPAPGVMQVTDGRVEIVTGRAEDGSRSLSLTIGAAGRPGEIVDFPASGGNPVLMVFLESAVRSMAAMSGGSPFYIRNRVKEALRQGVMTEARQDFAGRSVATRTITLRPFETDPNRGRTGAFAGLTLRFVVSDAVSGNFLELSADTPEAASGYHETFVLTDAAEAGP